MVNHVLDSDVVVLLQSKDVLTRPWCLLELYAAATAGIPIVSLDCSGKGYDFAAAEDHLLHLDTSILTSNPSAVEVLEANDAPVLRVAQVLWACIPNIISVPLNSSGSENAIRTAVADLIKAMQRAKAMPIPSDGEAWLEDREARDGAAMVEVVERGTIRGTQRGRMLQKLERAEELDAEVAELKATLAAKDAVITTKDSALMALHEKKDAALNKVEQKMDAALEKRDLTIERLVGKVEKLKGEIERLKEKLGR